MKTNSILLFNITKEFKSILFNRLKETLKPLGYKKSSNSFSLSNGDLTYFINVQFSRESTATSLKLTLNIEIASTFLFKYEDTSIPEKWYINYTKRIGSFQELPKDKWWTVQNQSQAESISGEIIEIVTKRVLPEMKVIQTTEDLAKLWRQKISPGLTDYQRKKYLGFWEQYQPVK